MYVMTSHGTLVSFDVRGERLLHLPMMEINEATRCIEIELPTDCSRTNFIAAIEDRRGERNPGCTSGLLVLRKISFGV